MDVLLNEFSKQLQKRSNNIATNMKGKQHENTFKRTKEQTKQSEL